MVGQVPSSQTLARLKSIVGPEGWLSDPQSVARYLSDVHDLFHGRTPLVLRPGSTRQVSEIVGLCFEAGIDIVPQGGNTGYMGGATPNASGNQIVVSLERMNHVRKVDPDNHTLTVEAGCILTEVQEAAQESGLLFPLSLGAEGSCQIGGNLSTNAGGTAVLHYGNCRALTLGLEVVLPDGRVWNGLRSLRKDNTGYDLRDLFIGAEGTLGIITAAVLRVFPRPEATATAMVALPRLSHAVSLLKHVRQFTGDLVTGFEYIQGAAMRLVAKHVSDSRVPLAEYDDLVLVELAGGVPGVDLNDVLEQALSAAFEGGLVEDVVMALNLAQRKAFWYAREHIPEALAREGRCIPCDVSVPVSAIPSFIPAASKAVTEYCPGIRVVSFGHVGDGNVHFDLLEPEGASGQAFVKDLHGITRAVYDVVQQFDGSFSAEHGIGQLKIGSMRRYRDRVEIDMLRSIKRALDPKGIMNPGKVVPPEGQGTA